MNGYTEENVAELKEMFYSVLSDNSRIGIFEQWVYDSEWLKSYLGEDDYLDLISMDFKGKAIFYDLKDFFSKNIGLAEYQQRLMIEKVRQALDALDDCNVLAGILMDFYEDYCDGYGFLKDLGLHYGLSCCVPPSYDSWDDLNERQKQKFISGFFPDIIYDLNRVLDWLVSGKIKFIEEKNIYGRQDYIDSRIPKEKESRHWKSPSTVGIIGIEIKFLWRKLLALKKSIRGFFQ